MRIKVAGSGPACSISAYLCVTRSSCKSSVRMSEVMLLDIAITAHGSFGFGPMQYT